MYGGTLTDYEARLYEAFCQDVLLPQCERRARYMAELKQARAERAHSGPSLGARLRLRLSRFGGRRRGTHPATG